jgi:serine protease Do
MGAAVRLGSLAEIPVMRIVYAVFLCAMPALLLAAGCAPQKQAVAPPSPAQSLDHAQAMTDFREVIKEAKDKVFPAVVFVKCIQETHELGKKVSQEVAGSGVLISPDGELLTNWHVVDKAVGVRCLLYDGRAMEAQVVGSDKDTDLALVRLQLAPGETTPFAVLGDSSKLSEGDFVMAMGAPWGLSRSVSLGILSCARRFLPERSEYSLWLQTDAAISPGNSGGPLVNTAGEVVGINTLGALVGGDMGFSVPSETVRHIAAQIREHGNVNWSWTGLRLQPLRDFNRDMYFDAKDGVMVADTDPESPARRAGILPKDRIIKVNDAPVTAWTEEDMPAIRRILGSLPKLEPATIEVVRDGVSVVVQVTPREKGRVEGEELDCPRWDMTVKTINQFDNPDLYVYRKAGVFIYGVRQPGNAWRAGLQRQDIILKIEGKDVATLGDVREIHKASLDNVTAKSRMVFSVLRNGLMRQVVLDFSREYEKE